MDDLSRVQAAIAALQAQRPLLGDAVVDTALAPLQAQLARLQAAAPQLRPVSVLFLDMVGSTALSERLDPEDMAALLDGLLARCTALVARHGGRTLQYAGDSLLAAFGTEQAGEDDAERAVHCGLALLEEGRRLGDQVRQAHGLAGCGVRVGIHSGPVLLGGGVDEEGTIRGQTVHLAARMEQSAPPGALRVSHDTWLLVRGAFEGEPQPPLQVKGHEAPLQTHLVRRARPAAERERARGLDGVATPLTGRAADLAALLQARAEVVGRGRSEALTLVAEAGVGKSRLLAELRARLDPADRVCTARSHPNTRLQPYGLLRDLLARELQIADSDTLAQARSRLAEGLRPGLPAAGDESPEARVVRLGQLLGIDGGDSPHLQGCSPLQLRRSALATLGDWLRRQAAGAPALVLLLEDLHWADEASLDALQDLLPPLAGLPLLLVGTARPELLEARPAWGEAWPRHRCHRLAPLDEAAGRALAAALLQPLAGDPAQARVLDLLQQRAAGNPFFMEELLRMLRDDGVLVDAGSPGRWALRSDRLAALRLPATLAGVLQARLDRLPPAERRALQQASIIGPVFWDEALAALDPQAPPQLPGLGARALVQPRVPSAFEGTQEHGFAHQLLQQVAYDTVLKPARLAGHAAAADWLAARVGQRASEYLAATADHCERAGDQERAFGFMRRACKAASDRYANATALEYADRALASPAAARDTRARLELLERRTWLLDAMGRRAEHQQAADAWEAAARAAGDDGLLASALFGQALLASRRSDEARSLGLALQAIEAAERGGNPLIAAQALAQVAWVRHTEGRNAEALAHAERALDRARAVPHDNPRGRNNVEIQLTVMLGMIQRACGRFAAARATLEQGLVLTRRHHNRRSECHLLESLASVERLCGRAEAALALGLDSLATATALDLPASVAWGHYQAGRCLVELDRLGEAEERFAAAVELAARCEERRLHAMALCRQGLVASSPEGARERFDRALALLEQPGGPPPAVGALVLGWRALAELAHGDVGAAARSLERLESLGDVDPGDDEEGPLVPDWARHRVLGAQGRSEAADSALRRAHDRLLAWVARIDDPALQAQALRGVRLHRAIDDAWRARGASASPAAPAPSAAAP